MLIIDRLDAQSDDVTGMWQMVAPTRLIIRTSAWPRIHRNGHRPVSVDARLFTVTATYAVYRGTGSDNFAQIQGMRILLFLMT
jgi:hypothetical protein